MRTVWVILRRMRWITVHLVRIVKYCASIYCMSRFVPHQAELKLRIISSDIRLPLRTISCKVIGSLTTIANSGSKLNTILGCMPCSSTDSAFHGNWNRPCSSYFNRSGRMNCQLFRNEIDVDGIVYRPWFGSVGGVEGG